MRRTFFLAFFLALRLSAPDPQTDLQEADRLYREATKLFVEGYYHDAVPVMEHALEIRESIWEPESPELAATLNELGRFYTAMVFRKKAESTLKRTLAIREKQLGPNHADTGRTVGLLADLYRKTGQLKEADPLFARAAQILQKSLGPEAPDLVEVLTNLGKFHKDTGNYPEAESDFVRAIAIAEKEWGPEHPKVGRALSELADLYSYKGNHADAEKTVQRALAIQEKTLGPDHPDTSDTLSRLALLYDAMARTAEAEALHKRVLLSREQRLGPEHPHVGGTLNNLAVLDYRLGRFQEATELFRKAIQIEEKAYGPDHYHVLTDLNNLASALTAMGRFIDAEPLYLRVLESRQKNPASRELGHSWNNLGVHYRETGRYAEAERCLKNAVQMWEEGLGAESPLLATAWTNLGLLYSVSGRYEEAELLFKKSLSMREKVLGTEHPDVALSMHHLGNVYRVTRRYAEAEPLFLKALPIWEKNAGSENPRTAYTLNSLANLYRATGKNTEAEPLLQRALEIRRKNLGSDHPDVSYTLMDLAQLYAATGRHAGAHRLFLEGTSIQAKMRESVFTLLSERQKLTFVQTQTPALHAFLGHTARFMAGDSTTVEEAFALWLRWKGSVQEAQGRSLNAAILSGDPEIRTKWEELQVVRRQIARMWLAGPGKMKLEIYRSVLAEQQQKKESLEVDLSRLSQAYALEQQVGRADLQKMELLLPGDGVYLDYAKIEFRESLQDQPTGIHYMVFVMTNGHSVQLMDLGPAEKIDSLIEAYRNEIGRAIEKGRPDRDQTRQMRKLGSQLYERLVKPVAALLIARKHLLISPDGLLHMIPLELLVTDHGEYLLEKYEITYLGSGRDMVRWNDQTRSAGKAVVMADPDFELSSQGRSTMLTQLGLTENNLRGGISGRLRDWSFTRLPATREEGKEVTEFLKQKMKIPAHLYMNQEALEEVLLAAESPRVLHLATHGYFLEDEAKGSQSEPAEQGIPEASWEDPSVRSGIVLAGANRSLKEGRDEGLVSATKIESLRLQGTELVVLSACDTGIGSIRNGEGVYGLKRSFVLAGAQTLVLSLWKVPDKTTRELMSYFYTFWTSGLTKGEAIRRARLEIRKKYDNPFYWAAFQLIGNPS